MKKCVLISMYALNIGGAERSLIGLLESFDYSMYDVDLFLYRHEGEFLNLVPRDVNLLPAISEYTTFERPIKNILLEGHFYLAAARILAKIKSKWKNRGLKIDQGTYKTLQYTWKYSLPVLPKLKKEYDLAIGFLGPHDFIINKVNSRKKIGWVHTDYSIVNSDIELDKKMWNRLDGIMHVSIDCRNSFLNIFPEFKDKTVVIENILSPGFVRKQAETNVKDEMPDDGSIKICSVGRFSYLKGFDMAVLACKKLIESGYNIKWYLVGYGTDENIINTLIDRHNLKKNFIVLGKKTNPYPYIKECDIYCQPSRIEGKAVTVREAQMLGKPVVITNYPTSNSQLEDGEDGHICALSVEGIAEGIKKLIEDNELRNRLARNTGLRNYGNQNEIDKIYKMIE